MKKINECELMIKGITHIGRARSNSKQNPPDALIDLKIGIELINEAVSMNPEDLFLRKERLARFWGISMNSPLDLIETVLEDISFFSKKLEILEPEYKGFYYYITGLYNIHKGDCALGKLLLENCLRLNSSSLEAREIEMILATL